MTTAERVLSLEGLLVAAGLLVWHLLNVTFFKLFIYLFIFLQINTILALSAELVEST